MKVMLLVLPALIFIYIYGAISLRMSYRRLL